MWIEFDKNLGIQALLPSRQSQLVIFTKLLFIMGQYHRLNNNKLFIIVKSMDSTHNYVT